MKLKELRFTGSYYIGGGGNKSHVTAETHAIALIPDGALIRSLKDGSVWWVPSACIGPSLVDEDDEAAAEGDAGPPARRPRQSRPATPVPG